MVNLLITFFSSSDLQPRRLRGRARAITVRPQPYFLEQQKSGGEGRGARRRGGVERSVKLRLGERLMDLPGGGHRTDKDGRRARDRGAALVLVCSMPASGQVHESF